MAFVKASEKSVDYKSSLYVSEPVASKFLWACLHMHTKNPMAMDSGINKSVGGIVVVTG